MLRVFFGRHKSASTWATLIIERLCNELAWKCVTAYKIVIDEHGSLAALIEKEKPDFLIIPEADAGQIEQLPASFRGFHITRDPRDLIVSGYFSHLKVHALVDSPEIGVTAEHRAKLQSLSKEEGIDLEIATIGRIPLQHLYEWDYDDPRIMEVKFEELTKTPYASFERVFGFLEILAPDAGTAFGARCLYNRLIRKAGLGGLRIPADRYTHKQLRKTLDDLSFENLKRGKPWWLHQNKAHYRKGKAGNWKEHLSERQEREIFSLFPGMMEKLGYEPSFQGHKKPEGA